jgi:hypothetical protein
MPKKQSAPISEQLTASVRAPTSRTAAGTKDADRISPSGIIAADRPISAGDMPCFCIKSVNSGELNPCAAPNIASAAVTPASAAHCVPASPSLEPVATILSSI